MPDTTLFFLRAMCSNRDWSPNQPFYYESEDRTIQGTLRATDRGQAKRMIAARYADKGITPRFRA